MAKGPQLRGGVGRGWDWDKLVKATRTALPKGCRIISKIITHTVRVLPWAFVQRIL